jgi:hypothetical protein
MLSGNYAYYSPDIAAVFDESFDRAGVNPKTLGNDHFNSAFRSLALLINSEWLTYGIRTWQFQELSFTTVPGDPGIHTVLPVGVMTVSDAILRRDMRDTPINPMARSEWLEIPDKTQTGRPDRYLVEKQTTQVTMTVWRAPENNTDQIRYWAMMNNQQPGDDLTGTLDVRPEMLEALHAGMAAKLAMKFNAQRYQVLQEYYRGADPNPRNIGGVLAMALDANRDWGDVRFTFYKPRRGLCS